MPHLLPWYAEWSPAVTGALGGGAALVAAVLLFLIATALGPDLPVLQCVGPRFRAYIHLTAFSWFVRGALVLTSLPLPVRAGVVVICSPAGERHPHWDMVWSWGQTCGLVAYALVYLWGQRMPPEVRERFDRRAQARLARVRELVAAGRPADAKLAAANPCADAAITELGLTPQAREALSTAPDPFRG